jgi:hypothetical protein
MPGGQTHAHRLASNLFGESHDVNVHSGTQVQFTKENT